jgi:hypothetical protein
MKENETAVKYFTLRGRREMHTEFQWGNVKTDRLEYLGVDRRIILNWMLDIGMEGCGLGSSG